MRKLYFILLAFLFTMGSYAQNDEEVVWDLGIGGSSTLVSGDLSSINDVESHSINPGFYVYVNRMFTPAFGIELKGQALGLKGLSDKITDNTTENIAYTGEQLYFEGDSFGAELNLRVNINGLVESLQRSKFVISAYGGLGSHYYNSEVFDFVGSEVGNSYTPNTRLKSNSMYYTGGLGIQYYLGRRVNLELRHTFNFNAEDDLDAVVSDKTSGDKFQVTHLGLVFKIFRMHDRDIVQKEKKEEEVLVDTDKDGVYDNVDKEINTPLGAKVDVDGVALDTDEDGVIDLYDKCVTIKGERELEGCPKDTDKDGVYDMNDACPEVAGSKENKGCPKDTDKDGVYDKDDACPSIPGVKENKGCPLKDSDKDGIADVDDACPTVPGIKANKGCPETITYKSEEIQMEDGKTARLIETVYFATNSDQIREIGRADLREAAKMMKENRDLKFLISGHTDSGGNRAYNLKLSQRRARNVRNYLVGRGVSPDRFDIIGYGYENPQYVENSMDAKQLNRRVEILVETGQGVEKGPKVLGAKTHTVKPGDTLYSIAKKYGVSVGQLKELNGLTSNSLSIGTKLIVE